MKKIFTLLLAAVLMLTSAGCGKTEETDSAGIPKIKWYVMFQDQPDFQQVQDKINETVREKIGAELDIERLDLAGYADKLKLIVAAQENFDLCFTSPDYGWRSFVENGALLPLDDLIKEYAPKSYTQIPEEYWDAARVDGKIYGFINYQIVARQNGLVILDEALQGTGADLSAVKKLSDMGPVLEKVKANAAPDDIIIAAAARDFMKDHDIKILEDLAGCVDKAGSELKIFNLYASPEYKAAAEMMRDWYLKGYVNKDPGATNIREKIGTGKVKMWYETLNPGAEASFKQIAGNREIQTLLLHPAKINADDIIATMQGVSATSKHPELAVQFLELMNTNENDIYNTLNFGIEGKHYKKVSQNRIEPVPNAGWQPNMAWEFGNQFNAYLIPGQADTVWEDTIALNNFSEKSALFGFVFDKTPVTNELANCNAVVEEYQTTLGGGMVDPGQYLPEFLEKLDKAGIDTVIAEMQKQVDAWKSAK